MEILALQKVIAEVMVEASDVIMADVRRSIHGRSTINGGNELHHSNSYQPDLGQESS